MLKVFLTPHDSGLYVALRAEHPGGGRRHHLGVHVASAIELLRSEFAFVIIDTGAGLDEDCLAAIEHSTDLVFVGATDVAGVRNVRKEIDVLDRLDLGRRSGILVLNHADDKVGLEHERH